MAEPLRAQGGPVAAPIQTTGPHHDDTEIRAYKLGKKRWSYNQVELRLGEAGGGDRTATVRQTAFAAEAKFPAGVQDSAICFNVMLQTGHKLQAHLFVVYDSQTEEEQQAEEDEPAQQQQQQQEAAAPAGSAPPEPEARDGRALVDSTASLESVQQGAAAAEPAAAAGGGSGGQDAAADQAAAAAAEGNGSGAASAGSGSPCTWNLVLRKDCCKGCQGCILRPIQRFGRLGKRSWNEGPADAAAAAAVAAAAAPAKESGEEAAAAAAAAGGGSMVMKDPRYMYVSIDEACTHVDAPAFRLIAGIYDSSGGRLLATAVSPPVRVLANNDVPTGAARIPLEAHLPSDWEGWTTPADPEALAEAEALLKPKRVRAARRARKVEDHATPSKPSTSGNSGSAHLGAGTPVGAADGIVHHDKQGSGTLLSGGQQHSMQHVPGLPPTSPVPPNASAAFAQVAAALLGGGGGGSSFLDGRLAQMQAQLQQQQMQQQQMQQQQQQMQQQQMQEHVKAERERSIHSRSVSLSAGPNASWDTAHQQQQQQQHSLSLSQQRQGSQQSGQTLPPDAGKCVRSLALPGAGAASPLLPLSHWQAPPAQSAQRAASMATPGAATPSAFQPPFPPRSFSTPVDPDGRSLGPAVSAPVGQWASAANGSGPSPPPDGSCPGSLSVGEGSLPLALPPDRAALWQQLQLVKRRRLAAAVQAHLAAQQQQQMFGTQASQLTSMSPCSSDAASLTANFQAAASLGSGPPSSHWAPSGGNQVFGGLDMRTRLPNAGSFDLPGGSQGTTLQGLAMQLNQAASSPAPLPSNLLGDGAGAADPAANDAAARQAALLRFSEAQLQAASRAAASRAAFLSAALQGGGSQQGWPGQQPEGMLGLESHNPGLMGLDAASGGLGHQAPSPALLAALPGVAAPAQGGGLLGGFDGLASIFDDVPNAPFLRV